MIEKITDIFSKKEKTFSFEFFPPKTQAGVESLYKTAEELSLLRPDFISVTYGAGGSTRGTTMEICAEIQKRLNISVMHHLERGAPGLHFFTLNKAEPTREIWNRLGL